MMLWEKLRVYERFSHLQKGEISIGDKPHSGHTSTSKTVKNVEKVHATELEDGRWITESNCRVIWPNLWQMRRLVFPL